MHHFTRCFSLALVVVATSVALASEHAPLSPVHLRCEYRENPLGIDVATPRLSWRVTSTARGQMQTAYRVLVASSRDLIDRGTGDLWDSGKVMSNQTTFVPYGGKPLTSRMSVYWKVAVWNGSNDPTYSDAATWTMGLLDQTDWSAEYIAFRDPDPVSTDVESLHLPPARQYRKAFATEKEISRATVYATALGIYELHLNGNRVGDEYFAPGWTDYRQRAYYNTYDVTGLIESGDNAIGAWVADGWYAGYVGFGLLTGMGTEKTGRATYGKTPAVMAQLEIEYTDGSMQTVVTDPSWKVSGDGPIQEADLLMGESYDAGREMAGWAMAEFDDSDWQSAILASDNGSTKATFYQRRNPTKPGQGVENLGAEEEFGFVRPKLEAFPGVPVRITQEIASKSITKREPGTYVFDLGQNFAGVIRLNVQGPAGTKVQIRYGEMLHPDGRLMTENLRKARATDFYTLRGTGGIETYQPRFTFHGFQFVEVSNFPGTPTLQTVTGLVMHSDTPMTSTFECDDPMVNQLFSNVLWTQRSNFLDLPTDCPQRDERMGWTGDAQAYVATAAYNADIGAFYTKWLRELMESQRPSGAFPGYAPFPFQHGWDFGTAWADAGVICPWTMWQAYGDTRVIETCWEPMTRFMQWRDRTSVGDLGVSHGNAWGDWLAQGAETPLDYVDTIYYAISAKMMSEMADAIGRSDEAKRYAAQFARTKAAFNAKYVDDAGRVNVKTQTAQALALFADLIPDEKRDCTGKHLAKMLADNGNHMATGFLGTRPLLPVLTASGQNDLAVFLLQSREFPSWGYEIANGATTIWERWDSYTNEDAFGRHNAAMNSFSHYAFGAVCEWMFHDLAGIQSGGPGYETIVIRPRPPSPGSNAVVDPIRHVKASYDSIRGTIASEWKDADGSFQLNVAIPANTTAMVYLPTADVATITESGRPIDGNEFVRLVGVENGSAVLHVGSGKYKFATQTGLITSTIAIKTSTPIDRSTNPDDVDLTEAELLQQWDFSNPQDVAKWNARNNVDVVTRDDAAYFVATGDDSWLATALASPVSGDVVVQIRAMPARGVTSEIYWSAADMGFNPGQTTKRTLAKSDTVNEYLFLIRDSKPIVKLRFDPFTTYDQYADVGEMKIDSIAVYRLPSR